MPFYTTLGDVQRKTARKPARVVREIALDMKTQASELVRVTDIESESSTNRNLVSATILADMLESICQYCNTRGWNADRLIGFAESRKEQAL